MVHCNCCKYYNDRSTCPQRCLKLSDCSGARVLYVPIPCSALFSCQAAVPQSSCTHTRSGTDLMRFHPSWISILHFPDLQQCLSSSTSLASCGNLQVAAKYSHQAVETEHLLAAMLEQSNGLARRILQKAEADPSAILERVDNHLRGLPKVSGHNDQVRRCPRYTGSTTVTAGM